MTWRQVTRAPDVVVASSRDVLSAEETSTIALTGEERRRADRYRWPTDRDDFIAGHLLLRVSAADRLGVEPSDVVIEQRCARCGAAHGRPHVAGAPHVQLSMAHTRGVVAAAASFGAVGVDVERGDLDVSDDVMAATMTAAERDVIEGSPSRESAFVRQWVRKEALVKAGYASLDQLRTLDLAHVPVAAVDSPVVTSLAPAWPELFLLDWTDRETGTIGAVVSHAPATLRRFEPVTA